MEQENKLHYYKSQRHLTFTIICFVLSACSTFSYTGTIVDKEPFLITARYKTIPIDSVVLFPEITDIDTVLYKGLEDIVYLDSVYLLHSKYGESSWYEVVITESFDTMFVEVRCHQYEYYDRPTKSKFDGVYVFQGNYYLIRGDSHACNSLIKQFGDTIIFQTISRNTTIYYIPDCENNLPEYAVIKDCFYKGKLRKRYIEVNNTFYDNNIISQ